MSLYFATTNHGKYLTLRKELLPYNLDIEHAAIELPEPRSNDLSEIATAKVLAAYDHLKSPCIALDAGFYIPALNGFPGSYVNVALDTIGTHGILTLVEGKPRECEFRNALAFYDGVNEPRCFGSRSSGRLASSERGILEKQAWSPLWKLFIPDGTKKTLAEMTAEEYNAWRDIRKEESATSQLALWLN